MPKDPKLIFTGDTSGYFARVNRAGEIKASKLFEQAPSSVKGAIYQHEIGHIQLGHTQLKKKTLTAAEKLELEFAADAFAAKRGADATHALKYSLGLGEVTPHSDDIRKQRLIQLYGKGPKFKALQAQRLENLGVAKRALQYPLTPLDVKRDTIIEEGMGQAREVLFGRQAALEATPTVGSTAAKAVKKTKPSNILSKRNALIAAGAVAGVGVLTSLLADKEKFNPIDGMHPNSEGMGAQSVRDHSSFGSGHRGILDADLEEEIWKDKVIKAEEYRKYVKKMKMAQEMEMAMLITQGSSARKVLDEEIFWRNPANLSKVNAAFHERETIGSFGSYNPGKKNLNIGAILDPNDLIASFDRSMDPGDVIRNTLVTTNLLGWISPERVKETTLHEGLHAVWDLDIDPEDKETFYNEALSQLDQDANDIDMSTDIMNIANKAPVYMEMAQAANFTVRQGIKENNPYVDWMANEMFAHRGALQAYSDIDYELPKNKKLDQITQSYIRWSKDKKRKRVNPESIQLADYGKILEEELSAIDRAQAKASADDMVLPEGTRVQFSGLHPGSEGMGAEVIRDMTDFGSKNTIIAGISKATNVSKATKTLYRGTPKKIREHESLMDLSRLSGANRATEEFLEAIRVKEFSNRPSRLSSSFWSPKRSMAQQYTGGPDGWISTKKVIDEDTFFTDNAIFQEASLAVNDPFMGGETYATQVARKYWKGMSYEDAMKLDQPEVLLPGKTVAEGIHPASEGLGAQMIRKHSEFGSGYKRPAEQWKVEDEDVSFGMLRTGAAGIGVLAAAGLGYGFIANRSIIANRMAEDVLQRGTKSVAAQLGKGIAMNARERGSYLFPNLVAGAIKSPKMIEELGYNNKFLRGGAVGAIAGISMLGLGVSEIVGGTIAAGIGVVQGEEGAESQMRHEAAFGLRNSGMRWVGLGGISALGGAAYITQASKLGEGQFARTTKRLSNMSLNKFLKKLPVKPGGAVGKILNILPQKVKEFKPINRRTFLKSAAVFAGVGSISLGYELLLNKQISSNRGSIAERDFNNYNALQYMGGMAMNVIGAAGSIALTGYSYQRSSILYANVKNYLYTTGKEHAKYLKNLGSRFKKDISGKKDIISNFKTKAIKANKIGNFITGLRKPAMRKAGAIGAIGLTAANVLHQGIAREEINIGASISMAPATIGIGVIGGVGIKGVLDYHKSLKASGSGLGNVIKTGYSSLKANSGSIFALGKEGVGYTWQAIKTDVLATAKAAGGGTSKGISKIPIANKVAGTLATGVLGAGFLISGLGAMFATESVLGSKHGEAMAGFDTKMDEIGSPLITVGLSGKIATESIRGYFQYKKLKSGNNIDIVRPFKTQKIIEGLKKSDNAIFGLPLKYSQVGKGVDWFFEKQMKAQGNKSANIKEVIKSKRGLILGLGLVTASLLYSPNARKEENEETNSKTKKFNKIDGLHPGSEDMGAESIRKHSEFGSGYQGGFLSDEERQTISDIRRSTRGEHFAVQNRTEVTQSILDVFGGVKDIRERRATMALEKLRNGNGQKFAGMGNEGTFGGQMRRRITDFKAEFASRWDKWGNMAMKFLDGTEDLAFRRARRKAKQVGKMAIGEGMSGTAYLMKGNYKGKEFQFVRKVGEFGESEVSAQIASRAYAPSVYGWGKGEVGKYIDMEYFAGKELGKVDASEIAGLTNQINKTLKSVHKTGYTHGDTHLGNLFVIENAGKKHIGIIDFGKAAKAQAEGIEQDFRMVQEGITRKSTSSPISEGIQHVTEYSDPFAQSTRSPVSLAQLDPFAAPQNQQSLAGTISQLSKPAKANPVERQVNELYTQQAIERNRRFERRSRDAVGKGFKERKKAIGHMNPSNEGYM